MIEMSSLPWEVLQSSTENWLLKYKGRREERRQRRREGERKGGKAVTKYLLSISCCALHWIIYTHHLISTSFYSKQWRLQKVGNLFKITKLLCARARNQNHVCPSLNSCTFPYERQSPKWKWYLGISEISKTEAAFLLKEVIVRAGELYRSRTQQD